MKTAISIPDPIFHAAEGLAQRLGVSRSHLYAKAVAEYTESHKNQKVTEALNEVYGAGSSSLDNELSAMQSKSIPREEW
jgi:metal-responsive CopG/Arc/MetJ family transcriptional regulator